MKWCLRGSFLTSKEYLVIEKHLYGDFQGFLGTKDMISFKLDSKTTTMSTMNKQMKLWGISKKIKQKK